MVFVGGNSSGKNSKMRAIIDQADAHIRDFYDALPADVKSDLLHFLRSYVKLKSNLEYLARFAALQQRLDKGIVKQPANADVLATTKSFATVDQILAFVKKIKRLD